MKAIPFEGNTSGMRYEYHRTREGPNWFMCYYKDCSQIRLDPKDAWRTIGVAKFTDTGKALKEWCLSMHEQYGTKEETEGRKDTSFASDVGVSDETSSEVQKEEEPNDNTKMIT